MFTTKRCIYRGQLVFHHNTADELPDEVVLYNDRPKPGLKNYTLHCGNFALAIVTFSDKDVMDYISAGLRICDCPAQHLIDIPIICDRYYREVARFRVIKPRHIAELINRYLLPELTNIVMQYNQPHDKTYRRVQVAKI